MILFSLSVKSQSTDDLIRDEEITEIILNFKKNGIRKFKIGIQIQENEDKPEKYTYRYSIDNDSIITFKSRDRFKFDKQKFILRDKYFVYLWNKELQDAIDKWETKHFSKKRDSANVIFINHFDIVENDTILVWKYKTVIDSISNNSITNGYSVNPDTLKRRTEKNYLKDGTIQELYYTLDSEGLYLYLDFKEKSTVVKTENQETFTTYTIRKQIIANSSPREYRKSSTIETKVIYYNQNGLIEKISLVSNYVENHNIETRIFIPK